MKKTLGQREAQYAGLRARLTAIGWISQGYVQDRGPGAGGPCYQCKVTRGFVKNDRGFVNFREFRKNWPDARRGQGGVGMAVKGGCKGVVGGLHGGCRGRESAATAATYEQLRIP